MRRVDVIGLPRVLWICEVHNKWKQKNKAFNLLINVNLFLVAYSKNTVPTLLSMTSRETKSPVFSNKCERMWHIQFMDMRVSKPSASAHCT